MPRGRPHDREQAVAVTAAPQLRLHKALGRHVHRRVRRAQVLDERGARPHGRTTAEQWADSQRRGRTNTSTRPAVHAKRGRRRGSGRRGRGATHGQRVRNRAGRRRGSRRARARSTPLLVLRQRQARGRRPTGRKPGAAVAAAARPVGRQHRRRHFDCGGGCAPPPHQAGPPDRARQTTHPRQGLRVIAR